MAREKGTFQVAANYEPLIAAPFDARSLVKTKDDLTAPQTWRQANGDIWIYAGMLVAVYGDPIAANNGLYILSNPAAYDQEVSWTKFADIAQIEALEERMNNLPTLENVKIIHGGDSNVAII